MKSKEFYVFWEDGVRKTQSVRIPSSSFSQSQSQASPYFSGSSAMSEANSEKG